MTGGVRRATPELMAILNLTPDSFFIGSRLGDHDEAVRRGVEAAAAGAAIIDVGGESTRPGAEPVSAAEQLRRTVPVIERLREAFDGRAPGASAATAGGAAGVDVASLGAVRISIDTTSADVAAAALAAGARIVNDVSAGLDDRAMLPLVAERRATIVLMHRTVAPRHDRYSHEYAIPPCSGDIVAAVAAFLRDRVVAAREAGIPAGSIVIDPGLGFGKSVEQNFALLRRLDELCAVHPTVLAGASRKSFIGHVGGAADPSDRLAGSVVAAVAAARGGASILRVHDVAATVQALAVAEAAGLGDTARVRAGP
ncbi:MAG TPA: dihydropteroate synthase [Phycisphaerales bacterium]|nr:dihydropteroate synthase [Phycisphaerales bacterium]HMP38573.1 dihydropteroate synthase [Phycisphaerales bacterium]